MGQCIIILWDGCFINIEPINLLESDGDYIAKLTLVYPESYADPNFYCVTAV